MIKILYCNNKKYLSKLSKLLIKRKSNDRISKNVVIKIISDVKKNGDKAVLKYEKIYNKNNNIIANKKNVSKAINLFVKTLNAFKKDINTKNNKSILKKLKQTKKVRFKIIKLKQDINKPDFGRD